MKKLASILITAIILMGSIKPTRVKAENSSDWMVGGTMATVWVLTGIINISRHYCCVDSDPNNACNRDNQDSVNCDAWRTNEAFLIVFPQ